MEDQQWEQTSNAAILCADIAPKGLRSQPTVTVTLLQAKPRLALQSEPYTFTVTAKFRHGGARKSTASATLYINYVRVW